MTRRKGILTIKGFIVIVVIAAGLVLISKHIGDTGFMTIYDSRITMYNSKSWSGETSYRTDVFLSNGMKVSVGWDKKAVGVIGVEQRYANVYGAYEAYSTINMVFGAKGYDPFIAGTCYKLLSDRWERKLIYFVDREDIIIRVSLAESDNIVLKLSARGFKAEIGDYHESEGWAEIHVSQSIAKVDAVRVFTFAQGEEPVWGNDCRTDDWSPTKDIKVELYGYTRSS